MVLCLIKKQSNLTPLISDQLDQALSSPPWEAGKPSVIIVHTTKGKGVSFMENKVEWHYRSPNQVQLTQALTELGAGNA